MQPRGRSPSRTRSEADAAAEALQTSTNDAAAALNTAAKDAETTCATSHPANHITSRKSRKPHPSSRLLRREKENAELREQIAAKDKQIADKDKKIEFMLQTINVLTAR